MNYILYLIYVFRFEIASLVVILLVVFLSGVKNENR